MSERLIPNRQHARRSVLTNWPAPGDPCPTTGETTPAPGHREDRRRFQTGFRKSLEDALNNKRSTSSSSRSRRDSGSFPLKCGGIAAKLPGSDRPGKRKGRVRIRVSTERPCSTRQLPDRPRLFKSRGNCTRNDSPRRPLRAIWRVDVFKSPNATCSRAGLADHQPQDPQPAIARCGMTIAGNLRANKGSE